MLYLFYKSRDFLQAIVICFTGLSVIVTAGFKAGLKERLDLTYSRNLISWNTRMFRETIIYKVRSTLFREIVSGHIIIIHLYTRFDIERFV